jgi:hypothetical protein
MIMTNTILRHGWILLPAILAPLAAFAAPPPHLVPAQLTRDGATQMVIGRCASSSATAACGCRSARSAGWSTTP